MVDHAQSGRFGTGVEHAEQVQDDERVLPFFCSVANWHGRFLGDGRVEHSGFYALRKITEGADDGTGAWPAHRDDDLFVHWRGGDFGVGRYLRAGDLGSRCVAGTFS